MDVYIYAKTRSLWTLNDTHAALYGCRSEVSACSPGGDKVMEVPGTVPPRVEKPLS